MKSFSNNKPISIIRFSRKFHFFLLFGAFFLLSGCSVYQYVLVDSNLGKNDLSEFVYENDTAIIRYSFSGYNFPLRIVLHNKLNQPLYVDTERSAVIINGEQLTDAFYVDGQPRFVSAGSYVTLSSVELMNQFINIKSDTVHKPVIRKSNIGKLYNYEESTSPVSFRVILALTVNEDYTYPTFFDYSFWVSGVLQTGTKPDSKNFSLPSQFYFKKSTGINSFFSTIGVVLLIVLGAMVAPE